MMLDLKTKKLELYKQFVIGKGFDTEKFEFSDFSVISYATDAVKLSLNVNRAFGYLSTDEEYEYVKLKKKLQKVEDDSELSFVTNIKSKLIDEIYFDTKDSKLTMTLRVCVYSRDITYPDTREYDKFKLEDSYKPEYIKIIYDVKESSVEGDVFEVTGDIKSILKSVEGDLDLGFFVQLDNLNPRIYLYMHLEMMELMHKNKMGYLNIEDALDNIRITSSVNMCELFGKISNNKISEENFRLDLEKALEDGLRFIPLVSLYDITKLLHRKGYYIPENSDHTNEFEKLVSLSEKEILSHYGLSSCKGYRVLVRKNMEHIYHIKYLEDIGFKYKEVINILSNVFVENFVTGNIFETPFVKKYISMNSKKDVVRKLFYYKGCAKTINDTIKMLDKIMSSNLDLLKRTNIAQERLTYENIDKYFSFNLNIKNLEAQIIETYVLIDGANYNFLYEEKEGAKSEFFEYNLPNLNYDYPEYPLYTNGEYSLWLPLNTAIIKKVGKELGLCIASYIEKIRDQELVLLFMKKGSNCIGCIELDSKYEMLVQAKIRYNKMFNEEEQKVIYDFCRENDMEICTSDMVKEYNTVKNYSKRIAI